MQHRLLDLEDGDSDLLIRLSHVRTALWVTIMRLAYCVTVSATVKRSSKKKKKKALAETTLFWHLSGLYDCTSRNHHHQSFNREGRWGTTDNFATSFLHFALFSTALWNLANSRPVHSLMLSSHLFLCPPCLLPPFTVPCKMVLARPDERETWPYPVSYTHLTLPTIRRV